RDLIGVRPRFRLPEQGAKGGGRDRIGRTRVQLLENLDDRPVRDPLAVRKAAPVDDTRVKCANGFGYEASLSDARFADDSHELAAAAVTGPLPSAQEFLQLALPTDKPRFVRALELPGDCEQAMRCDRLGFALELEHRPRLGLDSTDYERE